MSKKNKVKEKPDIENNSIVPVENVELPIVENNFVEDSEALAIQDEINIIEEKEVIVKIQPVSMKDSFAKQIEKTPYVLYQNGLTICRWKPNVRITLHDDTFEMNGNHYKYSGVEIQHI